MHTSLTGGLQLSTQDSEEGALESGPGDGVYGFLGRHVDLVYGAFEGRGVEFGLDLTEFLLDWRRSDTEESAKLALIVRLAEEVGRTVAEIAERPRRVLRRRRQMERVGSVRQIDPAGIRWLSRQPGRNLAERAGARQRILAVVRDETVDTLENRVVRDLLDRSAVECRVWLHENKAYQENQRWSTVDTYYSAVRRWRRVGPLADVRRVHSVVEPNYVLQHDLRYSAVWPWYQRLRRRQEQEDQLWRWSHRTFAESLRLALAWALDELEEEVREEDSPLYERCLVLRREQRHGQFVDPRTQFAGWILPGTGGPLAVAILDGERIRSLEREFRTGTTFHELVPDALVVVHDPYRRTPPDRYLALWTRMRFDQTADGSDCTSELATAVARCRGRAQVAAALVEPTPGTEGPVEQEVRLVPVENGPPVQVARITVPLRPAKARTSLMELVRTTLLQGVLG